MAFIKRKRGLMAKNNTARVTKISERAQGPRFETEINISPENRQRVIALLNARLADSVDLYSQTKFAHWNVKGKDFYQLHLLFDQIAEVVEKGVDELAERITALGGQANGTIRQAAAASSLDEYDLEAREGMDHVRALAARLADVTNGARDGVDKAEEYEDKVTADLLTAICGELDKHLYFLEAHLR
jgi:starvation-inducible DNA-binding protein